MCPAQQGEDSISAYLNAYTYNVYRVNCSSELHKNDITMIRLASNNDIQIVNNVFDAHFCRLHAWLA